MSYSNTTGLPSVTEIINSACVNWTPIDFFTEEGRSRGTAVHEWCAAYITGQYCLQLKQGWRGYCESFQRWADQYVKEVALVEKRLISKYGYCGQIDLVYRKEGLKHYGLLDIKTGAKSKSHGLQIAAYRQLAAENKLPTAFGEVLRLKDDGSMPIVDQMPVDYSTDFNIFIGCFNTFNFFNRR